MLDHDYTDDEFRLVQRLLPYLESVERIGRAEGIAYVCVRFDNGVEVLWEDEEAQARFPEDPDGFAPRLGIEQVREAVREVDATLGPDPRGGRAPSG